MIMPLPQEQPGADLGVDSLEAHDPASVGGHRLLGRLGEGGMGVVYLGLDSATGRKVAVKVIRPDRSESAEFRARFDSEVSHARRVAPFCTAQVLDHGEDGELSYLVTEYIRGPSLSEHVTAHGGLPLGPLRSLAAGVAAALTAIHAVRLVHRDLKPSNVLLAADGPRVIDFGISRALDTDDHHTRTGAVIGSGGYMAPEQALGKRVGTAADVFAWGTLVAYAATGRNPFGTGSAAVLAARAQQAAYDLSGLPPDFEPVIRSALDPEPSRRPTAEALLARFVGEHAQRETVTDIIHDTWRLGTTVHDAVPADSSVGPTGRAGEGPRTPRRPWPWMLVAVGATVVAATSTTAYLLGGGDGTRTEAGRPTGNTGQPAPATPGGKADTPLPQDPTFSSVTGVMLKNPKAGRCVDIPGLHGGRLGSAVRVWNCNTSSPDNQRWDLMVGPGKGPRGASLFVVRNSKSRNCFDVPGREGGVPGAALTEGVCHPGPGDNQMWYLEKKGNGRFSVRHATGDRLCLGVAGKGRHRDGDRLRLFECGSQHAQLWSFGWT
ncbi:hypothetical protein DMH08_05970 [Actinomadura sp. WAC 06369]|nr:hypothetical protein DMH08_05970 [Actinomadura sp. WAC 06369]